MSVDFEPPEVVMGQTIAVTSCDDPTCQAVHLRVYYEPNHLIAHCKMTIETSIWLIEQLDALIKRRREENPQMTN